MKKDTAEGAKPLLFINHAPNSQPNIDRNNLPRIFSHVSADYRQWLKQGRTRGLRATRGSVRSLSMRTIQPGTTIDKAGLVTAQSRDSSKQSTRNKSKFPDQLTDDILFVRPPQGDPYNATPATRSSSQQQPPQLPGLVLYEGNSDPFSASAIDLDPASVAALTSAQSFLIFTGTAKFHLHTALRAELGDADNSHIDLHRCIYYGSQLHAVIAAGFLVQAMAGVSSARALSLSHKAKSIAMLRADLNHPDRLSSNIGLINILISLDVAAGNYDTAWAHVKSLASLAEANPNVADAFGHLLQTCDAWLACAMAAKPIYEPAKYDPGKASEQYWVSTVSTWAPGCSFIGGGTTTHDDDDATLLRHFDPALYSCFSGAREIIQLSNAIPFLAKDDPIRYDVEVWQANRFPALGGAIFGLCDLNARRGDALLLRGGRASSCGQGEYGANNDESDCRGFDAAAAVAAAAAAAVCYLKAATALAVHLHYGSIYMEDPATLDPSNVVLRLGGLLEQYSAAAAAAAAGAAALTKKKMKKNTADEDDDSKDKNDIQQHILLWTTFMHAMSVDLCAGRGLAYDEGEALVRFQSLCDGELFRMDNAGSDARDGIKVALARVVYTESLMGEFLDALVVDYAAASLRGGVVVVERNKKKRKEPLLSTREWQRVLKRYAHSRFCC